MSSVFENFVEKLQEKRDRNIKSRIDSVIDDL